MLKITRKVEYALIALNHLQQQDDGDLSSAKEISKQYGIPKELLAKTLQKLARVGIIEAVQGPSGGYKLLVDPGAINLTHFFEVLEGPVAIMDCYFDLDCVQLNTCNIRSPINKINDTIRNVFNNMTLADLN